MKSLQQMACGGEWGQFRYFALESFGENTSGEAERDALGTEFSHDMQDLKKEVEPSTEDEKSSPKLAEQIEQIPENIRLYEEIKNLIRSYLPEGVTLIDPIINSSKSLVRYYEKDANGEEVCILRFNTADSGKSKCKITLQRSFNKKDDFAIMVLLATPKEGGSYKITETGVIMNKEGQIINGSSDAFKIAKEICSIYEKTRN